MGNRSVKINDKFHKLIVIEKLPSRMRNGSMLSRWKCICDCGKTHITEGYQLLRGAVKSCGCLRKETKLTNPKSHTLPPGEATLNGIYKQYKERASRKNLEFSLEKELFKVLLKSNCSYCNSPPSSHWRKGNIRTYVLANGIDRKDPLIGYTIDNSITCCKTCNYGKSSLSYNDWIDYLNNLVRYRSTL